jgi:4-aminobutyrate aminotransferase-like enzyme
LAREADAEEISIVDSKDGYLIGPRGKRFIDFTSGWCVGNFGWNDRSIRAALRNFKGPTYVYPGYRYKAWDELAAVLCDLAPENLTHCFRATGGSEAVDLALQAAMVHTGRRKFISLEDSYHGNTIGGLSVGSGDRDTSPRNCAPRARRPIRSGLGLRISRSATMRVSRPPTRQSEQANAMQLRTFPDALTPVSSAKDRVPSP